MKLGAKETIFGAVAAVALGLVAITSAVGQTAPASRPAAPANRPAASRQATPAKRPATAASGPLMADQVYKNIKVLRGLREDQFMDTMGFISGALGTNCVFCHDTGIASGTPKRWTAFAADTNPNKEMARKMILMVQRINAAYFGGQNVVTCYSCHRGLEDPPKVIPELALQYAAPSEDEPDQIVRQDPNTPQPDQILDKYIVAMGGAARLATLKSFVAKGTYSGYDTDFEAVPMEVHAKAPDKRALIMHTPFGERSEIFNGSAGWNATPDTSQVLPVLPITGGRLDSQKVMAQLAFPMQIKDALTRWRTGPVTTISGAEPGAKDVQDREVYVVQGSNSGRLPVKLYFDKQSGLLVRVVSYVNTAIGMIPAEWDYMDFRDVSGIKMPFRWVATWTDGQSIYDLTDVQINAAVDDARFAKPAPPKLLTPVLNRAATQ